MAERKGLEPSASDVTGRRYNRLNYRSAKVTFTVTGRLYLYGSKNFVNKKIMFFLIFFLFFRFTFFERNFDAGERRGRYPGNAACLAEIKRFDPIEFFLNFSG